MYSSWEKEDGIYKLEFYQSPRGDYPAKDFLLSLPDKVRVKVGVWLNLLQEKGPQLPRPYADVLQEPVRELRISFGRLEVRLLYFFHHKYVVVTHGFLKKEWKVPKEEIERTLRYRNDWLVTTGGK